MQIGPRDTTITDRRRSARLARLHPPPRTHSERAKIAAPVPRRSRTAFRLRAPPARDLGPRPTDDGDGPGDRARSSRSRNSEIGPRSSKDSRHLSIVIGDATTSAEATGTSARPVAFLSTTTALRRKHSIGSLAFTRRPTPPTTATTCSFAPRHEWATARLPTAGRARDTAAQRAASVRRLAVSAGSTTQHREHG